MEPVFNIDEAIPETVNAASSSTPADDLGKIMPKLRTDQHIWGIYICLLIISVIELFSASSQEVEVNDI